MPPSDFLGRHPYAVRVYAGPEKRELYLGTPGEPGFQQMGLHGPGFGVLEQLGVHGVAWVDVRAAMQRTFTLPPTSMLAMLSTMPREQLLARGLIQTSVRSDVDRARFERDWNLIALLKSSIDEAGTIAPDALPAACLAFLASAPRRRGHRYERLIDLVNKTVSAPAIEAHAQIDAVNLWFVKEGDLTTIFHVEVELTDGRRTEFVLNAAKDRRAAERHTVVHEEMRRLGQRDARVMATYHVDTVTVQPRALERLDLRSQRVTVSAGEWLDNFHELHLYADSPCLHIWKDQQDAERTPLPPAASDDVWRQILHVHVRLSGLGHPRFAPVWTHVNAGDFVAHPGTDDSWRVRMIGTRGAPEGTRSASPVDYLVWLLLMGAVDEEGDGHGPRTVWWNNPEASIDAIASGLRESGADPASVRQLWLDARTALGNLMQTPALYPAYARLASADRAAFAELVQRTSEAIEKSQRPSG